MKLVIVKHVERQLIDHGLIYPVHVGDKKDLYAKNITVELVRKQAQHWQDQVLRDVESQQYKIRHY